VRACEWEHTACPPRSRRARSDGRPLRGWVVCRLPALATFSVLVLKEARSAVSKDGRRHGLVATRCSIRAAASTASCRRSTCRGARRRLPGTSKHWAPDKVALFLPAAIPHKKAVRPLAGGPRSNYGGITINEAAIVTAIPTAKKLVEFIAGAQDDLRDLPKHVRVVFGYAIFHEAPPWQGKTRP
jgi:hypothetical protein